VGGGVRLPRLWGRNPALGPICHPEWCRVFRPTLTLRARRAPTKRAVPSLSTSGETLTIEESMTLRARTEIAGNVGQEHEWSRR
jgi:hypothetical protein